MESSYCHTAERQNFVSEQSFRRSVVQRKEKKMFSALAIQKKISGIREIHLPNSNVNAQMTIFFAFLGQ